MRFWKYVLIILLVLATLGVVVPIEAKNGKEMAASTLPGTPPVVLHWRDLPVRVERSSLVRCRYSRLRAFVVDVEFRDGRLWYTEDTAYGDEAVEDIRLWWFVGESNPFLLYSDLTNIAYVDTDRDGTWDYRGQPGSDRVGDSVCDVAKKIRVRR